MPPLAEALVLASLALSSSSSAADLPVAFVELSDGHMVLAQVSSIGTSLPDSPAGAPLRLAIAPDAAGTGCSASLPSLSEPFAALLSRGNCSFVAKARAAQAAGASMLIIFDGLANKYAPISATAPLSAGACDVDCAEGSAVISASDATLPIALAGFPSCGRGCASGLCALTPPPGGAVADSLRTVCCVPNDYIIPGGTGGAQIAIPVIWLTAGDGFTLLTKVRDGVDVRVRAALRPMPAFDLSSYLIWILGIFGAAISSWTAAHLERAAYKRSRAGTPSADDAAAPSFLPIPEAIEELTLRSACSVVATASSVLLLLYFLLRSGVRIFFIVLGVFAIGAASALGVFIMQPICARVSRASPSCCGGRRACSVRVCAWEIDVDGSTLVSQICAWSAVGAWIALRHGTFAWVVQDFFCILLCMLSVTQVKLPGLRSAVLLLSALFLYDIFMVFLTPFIFAGESVMVEVASAGSPVPPPAGLPTPACYCRLHADDASVCAPQELMPILLAVPHSGWLGGFAMLGLGDIVVPALALSIALRADFALAAKEAETAESSGLLGVNSVEEPAPSARMRLSGASRSLSRDRRSLDPRDDASLGDSITARLHDALSIPRPRRGLCSFYAIGVAGYALGLTLALIAVHVFRLGQPALLYIVPAVLVPLLYTARARNELEELWLPKPLVAAPPPSIVSEEDADQQDEGGGGTEGN